MNADAIRAMRLCFPHIVLAIELERLCEIAYPRAQRVADQIQWAEDLLSGVRAIPKKELSDAQLDKLIGNPREQLRQRKIDYYKRYGKWP